LRIAQRELHSTRKKGKRSTTQNNGLEGSRKEEVEVNERGNGELGGREKILA